MCSRSQPSFANPRRRGVVLIFVVAVLVLLAVIATTYLSMARIDRVPTEIRGGLPGDDGPPQLTIPLGELQLDVFSWSNPIDPNTWDYRPNSGRTTNIYWDFDYLDDASLYATGAANDEDSNASFQVRQRHDPYLASRAPVPTPGNPAVPMWPKISRWVEKWDQDQWVFSGPGTDRKGYFESPYNPTNVWSAGYSPVDNIYHQRNYAQPTYIRIEYGSYPGTSFKSPIDYNQKIATYPAFMFPAASGVDAGKVVLAADADGDGVADSGLFPLDYLNTAANGVAGTPGEWSVPPIPAGFYGVGDPAHPLRWYAAVRIVDATAAVNLNTAWRRNADMPLTAAGGAQADTFSAVPSLPNYGFFRSNIGLFEMLPGLATGGSIPADGNQWQAFAELRFPDPTSALTSQSTGRADYEFSTIGEALEMQLARRPVVPGGPPAFKSFPYTLSSSLAFMNGLINPRESRSSLEYALKSDLYVNVPNWAAADFTDDRDKETRSFTFFAAPSTVLTAPGLYPPLLWWHSTYNPDDATRKAYFQTIGAYSSGAQIPARTIRHLLTTSNPQSTSSRMLEKATPPAWLKTEAGTAAAFMEPFQPGNPKGSINTDNFAKLWRQFYVAMADPNYPTTPPPVKSAAAVSGAPGDIVAAGHAVTLTDDESLYVRAAQAAVNAIDMRDTDDNITTKRIQVGNPVKEVMVAGCEKQLFITKVEIVTATDGTKQFRITVKNPYRSDLVGGATFTVNPAAYFIGLMPAGGGSYSDVKSFQSLSVPPIAGGDQQSFDIPVPIVGNGEIVLLRRRNADGSVSDNAADTRNPYTEPAAVATSNFDQLVCVDMVRIGDYSVAITLGFPYVRVETDWNIASTGTGVTLSAANTAAVSNPIDLDNLPPGVDRAKIGVANKFPFGAFPRLGDLMTIPYIGHYAIYQGLTATSALTDATPATLDVQKVTPSASPLITGRFTPALLPTPAAFGVLPPSYANDWRSRIFDNFTVLGNPMSDFMPNMAEESWLNGGSVPPVKPVEVKDNDPSIADSKSPIHGLININTAEKPVLMMVPWVTKADGTVDPVGNEAVVDAILARRRAAGGGPYRSILDVLDFTGTAAPIGYPQTAASANQGNFFTGAVAQPMTAYADRYHSFVRVSNLITTRSDAFVMYVLLQQWQDYGSDKPLLVPGTEKRIAVTIDRSQLRDLTKAETDFLLQAVGTN